MKTQAMTWRVTAAAHPSPWPAVATPLQALGEISSFSGRNRAQLTDVLVEYNRSVGNPLSETTIAAMRSDGAFVIGGQQPGLLLGPMYTLLKATGAVSLCRALQPRFKAPLIPAFWIASEDHDLEEVNRCYISGRKLVIPHEQLGHAGARPPVGRVSLEPHREMLTEYVRETIGGIRPCLAEAITALPFANYADMAARILATLLGPHGLVLVDPMQLRELAGPVLARAAERWDELQEELRRGAEELRAAGYTPPLEQLNLFEITDARRAVTVTSQTAEEIRRNPQRYSPSAGLRPIVQDAVLPTAVTLGGPSELLYLREIQPLYPRLGVTPSARLPRISATFIDADMLPRAARAGLTLPHLLEVQRRLEERDGVAVAHDDLADLERQGASLLERLTSLREGQNEKIIDKAAESIRYQVAKVVERVTQQRLEAAGAGKRNLQKIAEIVYPTGKLQERVVSPMEMLARYGGEFVDGIIERLDPLESRHQLVVIGEAESEGVDA